MKKVLAVLLIMCITAAALSGLIIGTSGENSPAPVPSEIAEILTTKKTVRFNSDGKFKIAVFSDLHSQNFSNDIKKVVKIEKPDLFIFTGDNLGAENGKTLDYLKSFIAKNVKSIEDAGIPWMAVYGNHDDEDGNCNMNFPKEDQQKIYESFEYCISKSGPENVYGVGNYVIPVMSSNGEKPVFNLWALDSNAKIDDHRPEMYSLTMLGNYLTYPSNYDYIHFSQIQWYFNTSETLEKYYGEKIPGLMFFHIPIPEYNIVSNNPEETDLQGVNGINHTYKGRFWEESPEINSGLFAAIYDRGDILGIYAGHRHTCNYIANYGGIDFGFIPTPLTTGTGSEPDVPGCRIIVLDENNPEEYETYCLSSSKGYIRDDVNIEKYPINTEKWTAGVANIPFNGNDPIEGRSFALSRGELSISANIPFSGYAAISNSKYAFSSSIPFSTLITFGDNYIGNGERDNQLGYYYHFSIMLSKNKPVYKRYGGAYFLFEDSGIELMLQQVDENDTRDVCLRVNGRVVGEENVGIGIYDDVLFEFEISGNDVLIYYTMQGKDKQLLFTANGAASIFAESGAYLSYSVSSYGAYTTSAHIIKEINGEAPNK